MRCYKVTGKFGIMTKLFFDKCIKVKNVHDLGRLYIMYFLIIRPFCAKLEHRFIF